MGIQRIRIDHQLAQIGLRTGHASLNIRMPKGQLTIKNTRPELNIEKQNPSFRINTQKLRSDLNIETPLQFTQSFRNKGRSQALRAARQYKDDGNYLGNVKAGGDRVPGLARNRQMSRLGPKQTNIGLMPPSPVELDWDTGSININWSRHNLVIDYNGRNTAEVSADTNYPVEVFLQRRPYFRVAVEEVRGAAGRFINSAV